jgi:uncharacterized membrane protein
MWYIIGLTIGLAVLVIATVLRRFQIAVKWYEWLLAAAGLAFVSFAIQNSMASVAEFEPIAPRMFLLLFLTPGLALIVTAAVLIWFRWFKKARSNQTAATAAS